jgi:polysaccharide export outer membrane protein
VNADLKKAHLIRDGKQQFNDFYGLFINGEVNKDIELQPEDIIYLPTNDQNKVYVVGAVMQAKAILYREGLRVLDAIFEAGGFGKFAKQNAVLILRKSEGKDLTIKIDVNELVKDGDLEQNIELARGDYVIVQEGIF